MRLHELERLPVKIGSATIKWISFQSRSHLKRKEISLPNELGNELFLVEGGNKFLFVDNGTSPPQYWFGGTDAKSVFLVQVTKEAFEAFVEKGETGFFDYLKPERIKELERVWKVVAGRQGDIWILRLGLSWSQLTLLFGLAMDFRIEEDESHSVFGTRHTLIGKIFDGKEVEDAGYSDIIICSGVLEAPNHPKVKLRGPHVLMQNEGLFEPELAD